MRIRPAVASDANAFLSLWKVLDTETEFMLYEPNERVISLDDQKSRLANAEGSPNVHMLVLEDADMTLLAGFCAGYRFRTLRDKHKLEVVIGLRQAYTGKRWGRKLLTQLESWAVSVGVSRLELGVTVSNVAAISLYKSLGFNIEGTKKNAVFLTSGFVDEHIMAKLI